MHLTQIATIISSVQPFDKNTAHDKVAEYIQSAGLNMGQIMNCLRLSLVGDAMGPDLFEIVELLGTDEVSSRINTSIEKISI
jgi:glutamyl-tRNA synthetase